MSEQRGLLDEQIAYYRARAGEYEDWWFRRGRYDHGPTANAAWFQEADQVKADLEGFAVGRSVLELACGTGLWTGELAARAAHVTAIDASPEALAIARAKLPDGNVDYVAEDLFQWQPRRAYDTCFFSFWLSHVPSDMMRPFWDAVGRALAPGGMVYLIDSARSERASARDHSLQGPDQEVMPRRLADGREYQIVKHWFDAPALQRLLAELGWNAEIRQTREFFVYGHASPPRLAASHE